ncbi:Hypothetical predicted protein, partial [Paramuricea clavata]
NHFTSETITNRVRVPLSNPASPNVSALSWSLTSKTTNDTASAHLTKKSDNSLSTLPGLKLVPLNIRSLKNNAHFLELRKFTKFNKIDVLTVSETWLNTSVTNKEIEIEGYKLHRLNRLHKKGGGVCAYIRKDIKSLVLKDLSYISETNFHQLWIKLQHKKSKSLLVCVSYRPPDNPLDCFEKYFKPNYVRALTMGKLIILLGDLNCDMLKPTPGSASLIKTTKELNLNQLIKSPTRITESSQTLVDVIFVSSPRLVVNGGVIETCISDHFPVMDNVDEKLTIFNEIFLNTLHKHAPVKTIKRERIYNSYPEENDRFSFTPVSCSEIRNIILAMPSNKSPGKDKVSMRVIKHSLPIYLKLSTVIYTNDLPSSVHHSKLESDLFTKRSDIHQRDTRQ